MKFAVIIPAAGSGTRFGSGNKIEFDLAGKPVFLRAVELFQGRDDVQQIILAVNPDDIDSFNFRWGDKLSFFGIVVAAGGKTDRWQTVGNALGLVDEACTHVAVHDAARPLASIALIDRVFSAAEQFAAVIPALPVSDTLKRVARSDTAADPDPLDAILGDSGKPAGTVRRVVETIDRSELVEVQTPQVFARELICRAYAEALEGHAVTDDASLVESLGQSVHVVDGESTNLKITHPGDAELAAAIVEKRQSQVVASLAKKRLFADEDE